MGFIFFLEDFAIRELSNEWVAVVKFVVLVSKKIFDAANGSARVLPRP
jgi:hypothetical protein